MMYDRWRSFKFRGGFPFHVRQRLLMERLWMPMIEDNDRFLCVRGALSPNPGNLKVPLDYQPPSSTDPGKKFSDCGLGCSS